MTEHLNMDDLLLNYIDGTCTTVEAEKVQQLIATDQTWARAYKSLQDLHLQLQSDMELMEPSMRFSKNVMEEIARLSIAPATRTYLNKRFIYAIGGFFGILLTAILVYAITLVNWVNSPASGGSLKMPVDLGQVNWTGAFNNNLIGGFAMVNVVLALVLLDRYLTNKKKQRHQAA